MRALGIDIGGTSVKIAVLEGDCVVETARSAPHANWKGLTGEQLLDVIMGLVLPCIHKAGWRAAESVGVCAPGMLDSERGVITRSMNLPGIVDVPLREVARAACGNPHARVHLCTDAHATAVDVWRSETPPAVGRMLVLAMGTGVGACVLDDGEPLRVSGASPGHFGQLDVSGPEDGADVPIGPDGGRGSLEGYVGVAALMARHGCSADEVAKRFGDRPATFRALARAIRIAHAMYRPQHVRLAGGVGIRLTAHVPRVREFVERELTGVAREGWTLACATSDFHAALGAAWISGR